MMVGDSYVARRSGIQYCDADTRGNDCSCFRCKPPRRTWSDWWYGLMAWYTVRQWQFADWLGDKIEGAFPAGGVVDLGTHVMVIDQGGQHVIPHEEARLRSLQFPTHAVVSRKLAAFDATPAVEAMQTFTDELSKLQEQAAENRRLLRNKKARDRYAAAKRKAKAGKKKASRKARRS